jgi:hypothetical protein
MGMKQVHFVTSNSFKMSASAVSLCIFLHICFSSLIVPVVPGRQLCVRNDTYCKGSALLYIVTTRDNVLADIAEPFHRNES